MLELEHLVSEPPEFGDELDVKPEQFGLVVVSLREGLISLQMMGRVSVDLNAESLRFFIHFRSR